MLSRFSLICEYSIFSYTILSLQVSSLLFPNINLNSCLWTKNTTKHSHTLLCKSISWIAVAASAIWYHNLWPQTCCYLLLYAKVVLLAFKPLLHNPFLWKERKINSIIAVIAFLAIASLVAPYSHSYHSTSMMLNVSVDSTPLFTILYSIGNMISSAVTIIGRGVL